MFVRLPPLWLEFILIIIIVGGKNFLGILRKSDSHFESTGSVPGPGLQRLNCRWAALSVQEPARSVGCVLDCHSAVVVHHQPEGHLALALAAAEVGLPCCVERQKGTVRVQLQVEGAHDLPGELRLLEQDLLRLCVDHLDDAVVAQSQGKHAIRRGKNLSLRNQIAALQAEDLLIQPPDSLPSAELSSLGLAVGKRPHSFTVLAVFHSEGEAT